LKAVHPKSAPLSKPIGELVMVLELVMALNKCLIVNSFLPRVSAVRAVAGNVTTTYRHTYPSPGKG